MTEKTSEENFVKQVTEQQYAYGFSTEITSYDVIGKGLNEDVVRMISARKEEPEWLLEFRLEAFRHWKTLKQPTWGHVRLPEIDYQAISY